MAKSKAKAELKIEYLPIEALKPYENNPRINDEAAKYVANSIKEFGFKVPAVIDKNNVLIAGHTRLKAAEMLKMKTIPCIRADDLTEEQAKAFRLADNKVSEAAQWDFGKLEIELADIEIDMQAFGFDFDMTAAGDFEGVTDDIAEDGYYGDERERTNSAYNLELLEDTELESDFWQMPIIRNDGFIPDEVIGFNYAKTNERKNVGIHFYIDDYQFERIWNYPEKYLDVLFEYDCIFSPDFSLYMDMPMPMKIWNIYRSRFIGAFYQNKGINVIPTVSWAEPETYKFCFKGIPKNSIVSVSTIGVKKDKEALKIWRDGMDEMIRQTEPETILVYGGALDYDYGKINVKYYENQVTKDWQGRYN